MEGDGGWLSKIERFGWRLAQAMLPYEVIVLSLALSVRLVIDPSLASTAVVAGSAVISHVARGAWRRRKRIEPEAGDQL